MSNWPHLPARRRIEEGLLFYTGATYLKMHHFNGQQRLQALEQEVMSACQETGLKLEAWAIFSNHYHLIGAVPENWDAKSFAKRIHGRTSQVVNKLDNAPGRKVWHGYRDTQLRTPESYLSRLHYVHQNPVKHGLVGAARMYPFCSAHWFETRADPAYVNLVYGMPVEELEIDDDY